MKRVAITTLGCKTNQFESAAIAESVSNKGFEIVPFSEVADIYIINTCTVTGKSDSESRRLIGRARRRNAAAKIVVTGCYAQLAFEEIRKLPGVSLVLGNNEKGEIAELLGKIEGEQKILVTDILQERHSKGLRLETFTERTRAFLQVQNGCESFCSYCIVPYVRGKNRSVEPDDAIGGILSFTEKGFKEVVLTGIHLGMYGMDLNPPVNLLDLLCAIEKRTDITRLRLGSLEPAEVTDPLVDFLAGSNIICPHFHIPLQSGNDQVLARMNRGYTTQFYKNVIDKLHSLVPDACLGTDIIAGFPGESEHEFETTCQFLESLPLAYFHVFPFSPRQQTPAATMGGQVKGQVVKERAKILRDLSDRKKEKYYKSFEGRELRVLVQSRESEDGYMGLSRNYIPVRIIGTNNSVNSEVNVRVRKAGKSSVSGDLTD